MIRLPDFQLEVVPHSASTNAELLERTNLHGVALLALSQSSGQGRRGRAWEFFPGNLALSLGFSLTKEEAEFTPLLSVMAGLALYETIKPYLRPQESFGLKWPNDLYLGQKKMAGLLVQARTQSEIRCVLGIGCNLLKAPADAVALADFAKTVPTPELFAQEFLRQLRDFASVEALLEAWEERCLHRGRSVFVGDLEKMQKAKHLKLQADGSLLVEMNGEEKVLRSEELSLRF